MKKLLLTLATFVVATNGWAETYQDAFPKASPVPSDFTINFTQKNFRFYNTELTTDNCRNTLFPNLAPGAAANLGNGWIKNNIDYDLHSEYQDGVIILGGAYTFANGAPIDDNINFFKQGISILDFRGQIGKALVINGKNSDFANYLYSNFANEFNLDSGFNIPSCEASINGAVQLFWILDKAIASQELKDNAEKGTIRCRVELSYYNPEDADVLQGIYRVSGSGDASQCNQTTTVNSKEFRQYSSDFVPDATEVGEMITNSWNPYRWMVYEFEVLREDGENAYSNLKMHVLPNATSKIDTGALLIRNIEVYFAPSNIRNSNPEKALAPTTVYKSWNDYTPDPVEISGTPLVDGKILTVTFNKNITRNSDKEITVSPVVDGLTPKVTVENKVITVSLEGYPAGTYSVTVPQGFVTVGARDYNAAVTKEITIEREVSQPTAGPTALEEGYGFTYTFDGALTEGEGSLSVVSASGNNAINVASSLAGNVLTVKVTDEDPAADTYTVTVPAGFVNIGTNGKNGVLNANIIVEAKAIPEAKQGLAKAEGNVLTVTFEAEVKVNENSQKAIEVAPAVEGLSPEVKTEGKVLTVTLAGYPANAYAVTIPEGYLKVGDIDYNAKIAEKVTINPTPVGYDGVEGNVSEGEGFTLTFEEVLSQGSGIISVTSNDPTETPSVNPSLEGNVLTVLLVNPKGGNTYTVTVPEGYVKVGDNGFNNAKEVIVEVEESKPEPELKYGDITPANYHFNTAQTIPFIPSFYNNANLVAGTADVYGDINGKDFYNEGLIAVGTAATGQTEDQQTAFKNAWSLVDLDGEVGKVAVFAGKNSDIIEVLNNYNPDKAEEWSKIRADEENSKGFQLHIWMDPNIKLPDPKEGYVHAKIEYNIYSNSKSESPKPVFTNIGISSNGNSLVGWNESANNFQFPENDCVDEDNNWDPTSWQVYEFDFFVQPTDNNGNNNLPARLRLGAQGSNAWDDYTVFIKDIAFEAIEGEISGSAVNLSKTEVKYNKVLGLDFSTPQQPSKPEPKPITGEIKVEDNVLTVTFESAIEKLNEEGKTVTVTPAVEGKTPLVVVGEKVITVTLADYPANEYRVTIPEGFVKVGDNDYNEAIEEKVTIEQKPEAKEGVAEVEGNVLTVTFEAEVKVNEDNQIEITVEPEVENLNPVVKTEGKVLTVTLANYPADEYTVTVPEGYLTVGTIDYNTKVEKKVTIEQKPEAKEGIAEVEGNVLTVTFEAEVKVNEENQDAIKLEPEVADLSPVVKVEGKVLTVTLAKYPADEYTVTVPEAYLTVGDIDYNKAVVKVITIDPVPVVTPDEDSIEGDDTAGEEIIDNDWAGFVVEEGKNLWTNETANNAEVSKKTYFNGTENKDLDEEAVKVTQDGIVISAPEDLGETLNSGVVHIKTGFELVKGVNYDFSCNVGTKTRAEGTPNILIKLNSENGEIGVANIKSDGAIHYASNAAHNGGFLVLEIHFGGNAGQDITIHNIVMAAHETAGEEDDPNQGGQTPGGDEGEGDENDPGQTPGEGEGNENDPGQTPGEGEGGENNPGEDGPSSGVNSIYDNEDVEYFTLSGQKVAHPSNGIFIRRQGNTTSKVIIR